MKQNELSQLIKKELLNGCGLEKDSNWSIDYRFYSKELFRMEKEGNYYRIYGKSIEVVPVYRHNGSEEDVCMKIEIIDWEANSGKRHAQIKLNPHQKESTIIRKIHKFVEENYK